MKKLIFILIILSLFLVVSCDKQTTTEIGSCNAYCQEKGYSSGKCFDCVYLEHIELPSECKSDNFFFDDATWDICTERRLEDNTQHGCLCESEISVEKECVTDDDCITGGCSGTICQSKNAEPIFTTCEYLPEYACYKEIKCGCISSKCQWEKTEEFDRCVEEARKLDREVVV